MNAWKGVKVCDFVKMHGLKPVLREPVAGQAKVLTLCAFQRDALTIQVLPQDSLWIPSVADMSDPVMLQPATMLENNHRFDLMIYVEKDHKPDRRPFGNREVVVQEVLVRDAMKKQVILEC